MPSVTRLAREVATKIWPVVTARSRQGWQWLRRNPLWSGSGIGAAVLIILLITHWNAYKKQREAFTPLFTLVAGLAIAGVTLMRHFAQTDADRQRRITESFSKAIEQLSSDKLEVRLGGIYALERISQESSQDHWTVMENLTAFVRERTQRTEAERIAKPRVEKRIQAIAHSVWENAGKPEGRSEEFWSEAVEQEAREACGEPPADIAAVLTVIRRRDEKQRERETREKKVLDFRQAVLRGADLIQAHLERAEFGSAHLEGAYLNIAHLEGAYLPGAYLEGANLGGAHLQRAHLYAHLKRASLLAAHLEGADLFGAEGLTQPQIIHACGDAETLLPPGLTRPAHWTQQKGSVAPAA